MNKEKKINPTGVKIFGWVLLLLIIQKIIAEVMNLFSINYFINNILLLLIVLLPCSLCMITLYYFSDNENFTLYCLFLKKAIPIHSILEIKYFAFGVFYFTIYRGMLNNKYEIPIILLCNKKKSKKKMEDFFEVLKRKNNLCVIIF
jgi:Fe-S-cluster containining protein